MKKRSYIDQNIKSIRNERRDLIEFRENIYFIYLLHYFILISKKQPDKRERKE